MHGTGKSRSACRDEEMTGTFSVQLSYGRPLFAYGSRHHGCLSQYRVRRYVYFSGQSS